MLTQYKLVIAVVMIVASFCMGWKVNDWRHDAIEKERIEQIAKLKDESDKLGRELVTALQSKQVEQIVIYRNIKKEIPNVTDNRICFADAHALSMWNNALNGVPSTTAGTIEASSATNTATDREVIANAVENFEQYTQVRNQLNALIDWHLNINKEY